MSSIPGMSDVIDMAEIGKKIGSAGGQTMGLIADDGKPKSCWLKSHGRGFGKPPTGLFSKEGAKCGEGKEISEGLCYDICA